MSRVAISTGSSHNTGVFTVSFETFLGAAKSGALRVKTSKGINLHTTFFVIGLTSQFLAAIRMPNCKGRSCGCGIRRGIRLGETLREVFSPARRRRYRSEEHTSELQS